MEISKLGEYFLIERIRKKFKEKVLVGIGDDAAVISTAKDKLILLTTDLLIEDVHFNLKYITPFQLGWKSLAINISDIAAMGGIPKYALISLGLMNKMKLEFFDEFYQGIKKISKEFQITIVGGDLNKSQKIIINIALLGEIEKNNLVLRKGAKLGDLIFVTGNLGDSGAGLYCLKKGILDLKKLIHSHLLPNPKVKEARNLVKTCKISSMIDISDGLSSDLIKLAKESKVGFIIYQDKIPISSSLKKFAKIHKKNPYDFALSSGEDYELLFTSSKDNLKKLFSLKFPIKLIGEIIKTKEYKIVLSSGKVIKLEEKGYNHFA